MRPSRRFLSNFPSPEKLSSFRSHAVGQVANDLYGVFMSRRLRQLGVRLNILNAGTVDTEIRRSGQFPWLVRRLIGLMESLMKSRMRDPKDYARMVQGMMNNENIEANEYPLLSAKGKGIVGSRNVNDTEMQQLLYRFTTEQIDEILQGGSALNWL